MTVIIFIIILAILILVHEFGHFIVAKNTGMRVDEFGLGLPPRAKKLFKKGETEYTLNWIPFGGFVKIWGEDMETGELAVGEEKEKKAEDESRRFGNRPKWAQAAVLVAGVAFNMIFAWMLFSVGFMIGMPTLFDGDTTESITDPQILITSVLPGSPAAEAGLEAGDEIRAIFNDTGLQREGEMVSVESVQNIVGTTAETVTFQVERAGAEEIIVVTPEEGIVPGQKAAGISLGLVGMLRYGFFSSLWHGAVRTVDATQMVAVGMYDLISGAITGNASLEAVTGPVGIAGMVGEASRLGIVYLLSFTALISINLAILNLLPFPALDGGRLVFVLAEAISRKRIPAKVYMWVNGLGFALLILLMIVVTFNDIVRLI